MTARVLTVDDDAEWRSILPASANVFASVEYARIYQQHSGYPASLYVDSYDLSRVAYPFFRRPISPLSFAARGFDARWDAVTPEYTGPIQLQVSAPATDFAAGFAAFCREQGIVAEFAHLHPWNCRAELLERSCIEPDREIVYVDLSNSPEQLWTGSLTYACRKNIKRARQENVRVFDAQSADDIREFYRIYVDTMDRHFALAKYYFNLDYFMAFFEQLPNNARFVLAEYRNRIIAGTLFLHDRDNVYSYLGGADRSFQQVRPSNAIVFDTIGWARQQNKRRLVLGGGYKPGDGVFNFKASFSPLRAKFLIYKRIHLPEEYQALCSAWSTYYQRALPANGYFPQYRAVPNPEGES